jgi:hypothetical protein
LCEQRRQFWRVRKERTKVIRGGVLDASGVEIMERMEGFESSQDFVQETQFDAQELCYGQSPEDSLGFEDYMARTQHGARARYRNSQPTLHFNSNDTPIRKTQFENNLSLHSNRPECMASFTYFS